MLLYYIISLILFFIIGTFLAYYSKRFLTTISISDYFIANRRLTGFLAFMTYAATTYSVFMIIGLVGLTYATGICSFGFELTYMIGTIILLTTIGYFIWREARKRNWITPGDMYLDMYGCRAFVYYYTIMCLIALIPYASIQVLGISYFVNTVLGGEYFLLSIIIAFIILLVWTLLAGIWSVAITDAYQGIIMLISGLSLLISIVYLTFTKLNLNTILSSEIFEITWPLDMFIAYTIPWYFFAITNPQVVQRLYMPRDENSYRRMVIGFVVFGTTYTIIVTLIGLFARVLAENNIIPFIDPKQRDLVTPTLVNYVHPVTACLVFVSVIAAASSTINSIILTLTSMIIKDIISNIKTLSEDYAIKISKVLITVILIIVSIFAYFRPGFIVDLAVLSSYMLLILAPITLLGLIFVDKLNKPKYTGLITLITGSLISGTFTIMHMLRVIHVFKSTIFGVPIPVLTLIVITCVMIIAYLIEKRVKNL